MPLPCSIRNSANNADADHASGGPTQHTKRIVIEALRFELSTPALVREYVKTYREEHNRAESEARRRRSTLDSDHAKAKAEIQRAVTSIAKGSITDAEAAPILESARRDIARLEGELATANGNTNVVELHPQAVQRFKDNIEALTEILAQAGAKPCRKPKRSI